MLPSASPVPGATVTPPAVGTIVQLEIASRPSAPGATVTSPWISSPSMTSRPGASSPVAAEPVTVMSPTSSGRSWLAARLPGARDWRSVSGSVTVGQSAAVRTSVLPAGTVTARSPVYVRLSITAITPSDGAGEAAFHAPTASDSDSNRLAESSAASRLTPFWKSIAESSVIHWLSAAWRSYGPPPMSAGKPYADETSSVSGAAAPGASARRPSCGSIATVAPVGARRVSSVRSQIDSSRDRDRGAVDPDGQDGHGGVEIATRRRHRPRRVEQGELGMER